MPTMELSSGFTSGYLGRVVQGDVNYSFHQSSFIHAYAASTNFYSSVKIMKGTMPTDFSTLTNGSTSRSSDILVQYYQTSGSTTFSVVNSMNPVTLTSLLVNAGASGTATWFWFLIASSNLNTIYHQFIGTVGVSGSGADLEIDSVNIVSGNSYKFTNLKIQIPTSWTW